MYECTMYWCTGVTVCGECLLFCPMRINQDQEKIKRKQLENAISPNILPWKRLVDELSSRPADDGMESSNSTKMQMFGITSVSNGRWIYSSPEWTLKSSQWVPISCEFS